MGESESLVRAAVRQLPGIVSVEIDLDGSDGVGQVRVRTADGAVWAEVEAAVQRVVAAADPAAALPRVVPLTGPVPAAASRLAPVPVRLVAAAPDPPPVPAAAGRDAATRERRARLCRVELRTSGSQATAAVSLSFGLRTGDGTASGVLSGAGPVRVGATAALRAVQSLVGETARLDLQDARVTTAGGRSLVLLRVGLLGGEKEQLLTGAAPVRLDRADAAARAALDAVNRRIEPFLPG